MDRPHHVLPVKGEDLMTATRRFVSTAVAVLTLALGLTAWVAPSAHASPAGGATRYSYSRIGWTGTQIVIAATDSHGHLYEFWQAAGKSAWHKELVSGASGYGKPSIAWTGRVVAIAVVDAAGDLVYFAQKPGSSHWSHQRIAKKSDGRFQLPSIAVIPGGTVLISVGNRSGLLSYERPFGGSWTKRQVASGTYGGSSVAAVYDGLISQYLGLITAVSGGTVYLWWERQDVGSWNRETIAAAGPGGGYDGPSITVTPSDLLVTAATSAGGVDFWYQPVGGSGWTGQTVAAAGTTVYGHPAIAYTGLVDGGPSFFYVITDTTQNGRLAFWWNLDGGSSWNLETVAANGSHAAYANPGISATGKAVVISAVNTKPGDVLFWRQAFGASPWHKQLVGKG
jgi:hypothetical protein